MGECLSPQNILLLATAASIRLAQGANGEQLELLSSFFNVLGENLALLALCAPSGEDGDDLTLDE